MIEYVQDSRFDQLRFHDRRNHLEHGLAGEHDGSLRNRPDAARKMEPRQVFEEIFPENAQGAEIFDIFI